MPLFGRAKELSRSQLSRAAASAQARGKLKKALRLYLQLLAHEPESREVQHKIAVLQARTRATEDAWLTFRFSAEAFALEGFASKAIGVYREAAHYLPHQTEAWTAIADIHLAHQRPQDALSALLEGRACMRSRKLRPEAIRLLALARDLAPTSFEIGFDLSSLYWKTGARVASMELLDEIERISTRPQLVCVRRARFLRHPNPVTGWRWLRATLRGR